MTGRRWILSAFSLFIILLVVWISAALILNLVTAEKLPYDLGFRSRLGANYGPDNIRGSLGIFQLSIIGEALRDRGIDPGDAEDQEEDLKLAFNSPVPTATARGFHGEPPYTATPTQTLTPTETHTLTLTVTLTSTPRPTTTPTRTRTQKPKPTNTPTITKTPTTTNTPTVTKTPTLTMTPTATNTPTPVDDKDPQISGGTLDPQPGYLGDGVCAPTIIVTNLKVKDPAPSYGVQWVKLKYQVIDYSGIIFSEPMDMVSGGATGDGGWCAIYQGEHVFEIDTNWPQPPSGKFKIKLWAKVLDKGGNENALFLGEYTMDGSCAGD
jgi:hypothetical protein